MQSHDLAGTTWRRSVGAIFHGLRGAPHGNLRCGFIREAEVDALPQVLERVRDFGWVPILDPCTARPLARMEHLPAVEVRVDDGRGRHGGDLRQGIAEFLWRIGCAGCSSCEVQQYPECQFHNSSFCLVCPRRPEYRPCASPHRRWMPRGFVAHATPHARIPMDALAGRGPLRGQAAEDPPGFAPRGAPQFGAVTLDGQRRHVAEKQGRRGGDFDWMRRPKLATSPPGSPSPHFPQ